MVYLSFQLVFFPRPILTEYFLLVRNPAIKIIGKRNERELGLPSNHATSCTKGISDLDLNQDSARVRPLVGQQPGTGSRQNPHRFNLAEAASSSSKTQEEASSRLEALLKTRPVNEQNQCKNSLKSFENNDYYPTLKSSQFQSRLPR